MPVRTWDVVRDGDGELLGRVSQVDGAWRPDAVFGAPLAESVPTRAEAENLVRREGLTALSEPWWVRSGDGWRPAWLLEIRGSAVRVSWSDPKYRFPGDQEWLDARTSPMVRGARPTD